MRIAMIAITWHDLRFRARQFIFAALGAALVFAMGILLSGLVAGFSAEITDTVGAMHAGSWVIASRSPGRVVALSPIPAAALGAVAAEPGVGRADPVIVVPQAATVKGQTADLVLIGIRPGGLGSPTVSHGRDVIRNGEAVVDTYLGIGIGSTFTVDGRTLTVVGTVSGHSLLGGQPDVYVTLHDAQLAVYGGRPLVGAVLTSGRPMAVPSGLAVRSSAQIESASLKQMASVVSSINRSKVLMWVIAAFIVAALVYVTALERTRDFAVLKALGSSSALLFLGLALQAVIVALTGAAVAAVIANFMTGIFDQPIDVPGNAYIVLPVAALAVGILSSVAALHRAVSVDPAVAFAGG